MEINDGFVHIVYLKRNEIIEIKGEINEFVFKIGTGSKMNGQTSYLKVMRNDVVLIRQYNKWGWQSSFKETTDYLEKNGILKPIKFWWSKSDS